MEVDANFHLVESNTYIAIDDGSYSAVLIQLLISV